MKTILISILLALGVVSAQVSSPSPAFGPDSEVTLTDAEGAVIGTGTVDAEALNLNLSRTFDGFVTLSIADDAGDVQHYDAIVSNDGIVVVSGDEFVELSELLAGSGLSLDVAVDADAVQGNRPSTRGGDDLDDVDERDDDFDDRDDDFDDRDDDIDDRDDDFDDDRGDLGDDDAGDRRDDRGDDDEDDDDEDDDDDDGDDD